MTQAITARDQRHDDRTSLAEHPKPSELDNRQRANATGRAYVAQLIDPVSGIAVAEGQADEIAIAVQIAVRQLPA